MNLFKQFSKEKYLAFSLSNSSWMTNSSNKYSYAGVKASDIVVGVFIYIFFESIPPSFSLQIYLESKIFLLMHL